jgi:phosphatidylglycerol:prolipoprotein diacylglycerol transferase
MLPTLDLGFWRVSTYAVMVTMAAIVVIVYGFERLLRLDAPVSVIGRGLFLATVGALGGVLLVALVPMVTHLLRTGSWGEDQGLSIIYALLGGFGVAILYAWRQHAPVGQALDLGGLPVPLAQAIGRLGCLAAGCCAGKINPSWLGMYLPNARGEWAVRYPTQLLSAGADLGIFIILLLVERYALRRAGRGKELVLSGATASQQAAAHRWPFDGFLFLLYVGLFSLKRFVIAFLREDAMPVLGPFSTMHLYAVAGLALATGLILYNLGRRQRAFVR